MISAGNHEFRLGQLRSNRIEGLDHKLEPFVGSPFAEGQNAVDRCTTSREVGEFRPSRQNAVGPQVDVVPSVLIVQDLAIAGHEHRDRVRKQQHSRRERAREPIDRLVTNSDVL